MNKGYILVHLGSLLLTEGDVAGAMRMQEESLRIAQELGDANLRAESHFQLAHDALVVGKVDDTRAYARLAAEHYVHADHLEGKAVHARVPVRHRSGGRRRGPRRAVARSSGRVA